ncbi:hypothetical protein BV22DRAFT_1030528 [Leucogyrophana mollusca]|uniref:Uncharacterized protein n=1 Tax=Leucogyrophana mollusca TaxID=85980 RepID=A0ACB8BT01_9AGAM|nr:hypothetical protein BV22DRAFT_1030528 [Leucogyrophana mollusca]
MPTLNGCPFTLGLPSLLGGDRHQDTSQPEQKSSKKSSRKFPWAAAGGLTLVALLVLTALCLAVSCVLRFSSTFFSLISLLLGGFGSVLSIFIGWPIKLLFSFVPVGTSSIYSPAVTSPLHCNNSMELQPWEVLTFVPGTDGNPKSVQYELNSPTPHAVSLIDIDYRDTRLDVFSNGKYYGSTSDFVVDKSVYCGEDLNVCIEKGFSMGTVIIPGGKQSVEIAWSGKDVFPGTDKIVWGGDRKRRVMWKKELCL